MCQAIREMMEDRLNEGISQGVNLSAKVFRAVNSGVTDNHQIAVQCNCAVSDVERIRAAFGF